MADAATTKSGWERALMAAEKVRERCRRAARALDEARVPYAVVGGNAVAEWVGRIDEDAVRNTRDVDILIQRRDFPAARSALEGVGFIYHQLLDVDTFSTVLRDAQAAAFTSSVPARKCGLRTNMPHRVSMNRNERPTSR
jgi:hypothetical protein